MVTAFNICPAAINICATRGDTQPFTFTRKKDGSAISIAGRSYILTVDPEPEPTGSGENLFALTGTLIDAGANGVVEFEMSAVQADQTPAEYYYDLQESDGSSKLRTIAKGTFTFEQDITK